MLMVSLLEQRRIGRRAENEADPCRPLAMLGHLKLILLAVKGHQRASDMVEFTFEKSCSVWRIEWKGLDERQGARLEAIAGSQAEKMVVAQSAGSSSGDKRTDGCFVGAENRGASAARPINRDGSPSALLQSAASGPASSE